LAGKILDVLGVYQVGTCLVLCPFPCDVLAMYWPSTLVLAPSVSGSGEGERATGMVKALTERAPTMREMRVSLENMMMGGVVRKSR